MDLIISQLYAAGDKLMYPTNTSGKTIYILVKVDDVYKIEKLVDNTYKIYYTVFMYDDETYKTSQSTVPVTIPTYKTMIVEESKLITLNNFTTVTATHI